MYISGDYFMICDRCGFKRRRSEIRKEWQGLYVCSDTCWEKKHPQLEIKARHDRQAVPVARPEATDVFLSAGDVTADDL